MSAPCWTTPLCRSRTGPGRWRPIMAASKPERPLWSAISLGCRSSKHDWPGLAGVGKITARREDKATGAVQIQDRYSLLSRVMPAQEFLDTVRAHWSIEHCLPWVLDVVMRE